MSRNLKTFKENDTMEFTEDLLNSAANANMISKLPNTELFYPSTSEVYDETDFMMSVEHIENIFEYLKTSCGDNIDRMITIKKENSNSVILDKNFKNIDISVRDRFGNIKYQNLIFSIGDLYDCLIDDINKKFSWTHIFEAKIPVWTVSYTLPNGKEGTIIMSARTGAHALLKFTTRAESEIDKEFELYLLEEPTLQFRQCCKLKNKYSFIVQFRTICMDDMDDGRTTSTLVKFEKLPGIFSEKEIYMHAMLKI